MTPVRVGVLCDYPEEGWASMDLTAEMVVAHLRAGHSGEFTPTHVCPPFRRRFARLPVAGRLGAAANADRLLNRLVDYPRVVRRLVRANAFDLYHLADHSYSQLLHVIPPGRGVVTCHDLDTFRCVLEPAREPRPHWFRTMAMHILAGLMKAAAVACNSETTRGELLALKILPADRLHVVPMGTHPSCSPDPDPAADLEADRLLGPRVGPEILHVGSNIPRKRIDVLIDVVAEVRRVRPDARLVKVGGAFPPEFQRRAEAAGVADVVTTLPFLDRRVLASVYRRASLVLITSEAEGFGLPAVEALACGTPLLASDLPALREVAADAAEYCAVGDVPGFAAAALKLLDHPSPRRAAGLARARHFSWSRHADRLAEIYREVLARLPR